MASQHAITRFWRHPRIREVRHALTPTRWLRFATASYRQLPNYLIAGTQKGGTTSLHGYLSQHPQVQVPRIKEVHYFDSHHSRGPDWYRTHFPIRAFRRGQICGESTPFYMFCPNTPARTARLLPNAKIIFLLRNPVDRAYSHYQLVRRRGWESLSFEEAVATEPERLEGERERLIADPEYRSRAYRNFSYLARGRYAEQILEWQKHFSPQQILILESEEFFRNTAAVYRRVLDFLQLSHWEPPAFANLYPGNYTSKMNLATRAKLTEYFARHNARLFHLLGQTFDWD